MAQAVKLILVLRFRLLEVLAALDQLMQAESSQLLEVLVLRLEVVRVRMHPYLQAVELDNTVFQMVAEISRKAGVGHLLILEVLVAMAAQCREQ